MGMMVMLQRTSTLSAPNDFSSLFEKPVTCTDAVDLEDVLGLNSSHGHAINSSLTAIGFHLIALVCHAVSDCTMLRDMVWQPELRSITFLPLTSGFPFSSASVSAPGPWHTAATSLSCT